MELGHLPVMPDEVLGTLAPAPGSLQIDATVGGGGHTERILEAANPDGRVLGLDADQAAIDRVAARLARYGDRLVLRQANFRELGSVAPAAGFAAVDGALFDLGLSSFQLADRDRGFGFRTGGPLDMRFDTSKGVPAAQLLATLDADELATLFRRYGEEPSAWKIAKAIVAARSIAPVETAEELAQVVETAVPVNPRQRRRIHPATRVFQALRIAVNEELDALPEGLAAVRGPAAARRPAGRPLVPLARGPHRQALLRGRTTGLHLPARGAGLRVRPRAPPASGHPALDDADPRGDRGQSPSPERASARRRASGRLSGPPSTDEECAARHRRPVPADPVDPPGP